MKFPSKLHSNLPKKCFPNRPHQQRASKLLQNRMTAKPKLLSQSHQALLQSDPEMSFSNRLHSKLPKKCFPKRPHQQRVSKLLQNRMTAKPKLLSQSHQTLLQSDPEMSFSNRLHSKLPKKCFANRPHQQRVSKLLQNRMTAHKTAFTITSSTSSKRPQNEFFKQASFKASNKSLSQTGLTNRECPSSFRIG